MFSNNEGSSRRKKIGEGVVYCKKKEIEAKFGYVRGSLMRISRKGERKSDGPMMKRPTAVYAFRKNASMACTCPLSPLATGRYRRCRRQRRSRPSSASESMFSILLKGLRLCPGIPWKACGRTPCAQQNLRPVPLPVRRTQRLMLTARLRVLPIFQQFTFSCGRQKKSGAHFQCL